ncbi:MAG: RNase adapter RapZ [Candidatus Abyssobacteria bacterium SURF_5]|uniref:RNase adapter RapZ n=1 Tax=Abyssobacteria bacterium (strain SURF_5) TaxID=2093360 RepID=A0A3A4P4P5_ABYX5|nr:MAG: RNase adapter RapZ [Candidatus Abyssubacteria bacterium SURF_5]
MRRSHFIVVTGLSGAGKSQAIKCLEDLGFFCVDNLPTMLIPKFAEVCTESGGRLKRVALGIDIREGGFLNRLFDELKYLKKEEFSYEILFLEARAEVLVNRYSETRRKHPLSGHTSLPAAIEGERRKMAKLRRLADYIVDTSDLNIHQLKDRLFKIFSANEMRPIIVNVLSFGYRYGVPQEVDMLFDVRFLPNPNYVPALKHCTGNQKNVAKYVLDSAAGEKFGQKLEDILDFLLPLFEREGKSYLTVAFGCTGGRHRSVVFANKMGRFLKEKGIEASVIHRDIRKK